MAQQSVRRGWDNQGLPLCFEHATGDLDPVRELPYRPAAVFLPHSKAGQMTASDHAQQRPQRFPLPGGGRPQMVSRPSPRRIGAMEQRARLAVWLSQPCPLAASRRIRRGRCTVCWASRRQQKGSAPELV